MKNEKKQNKKKKLWVWPVCVLLLAVFLSLSFSILSQIVLTGTSIAIAIVIILIFIAISILFDVLGLAVASASMDSFTAMAARKVKGSKQGLALIKNADKVSSVCADVIGDVCGILSGAAGASILTKIIIESGSFMEIFIPSLISAIIAGLTIFGKASFKKYAINNADAITLRLAKFLNFFTRKD